MLSAMAYTTGLGYRSRRHQFDSNLVLIILTSFSAKLYTNIFESAKITNFANLQLLKSVKLYLVRKCS